MTDIQNPTEAITAYLDGLVCSASPFVLRRDHDVTGVSGTGIVADGVLFPAAGKSKAVVRWRGERGSTVVWDNLGHVKEIHGHDGATVIELIPVGELAKALKAVVAIELAVDLPLEDADDFGHGQVAGWNEAIATVWQAITDSIEALHGHGDGEVR